MATTTIEPVNRLAFDRMFALDGLGDDRFRSLFNDGRKRRVFGGQLLGQGLAAAIATVGPDRHAHAFQVQFCKPGTSDTAFDYAVERVIDGRSFSSRRVTASQNGAVILQGMASFHVPEPGLGFSIEMPEVPDPETLRSEQDLRAEAVLAAGGSPATARAFEHLGFDVRPVFPQNPMRPAVKAPIQRFWVRPHDAIPEQPAKRAAMLAYLSDIMFLSTALHPHGLHWLSTPMDWASLNHSLWLHEDTDFSDWLLWDLQALWTGSARALARGSILSRDGRLIASASQEGLMRIK